MDNELDSDMSSKLPLLTDLFRSLRAGKTQLAG